MRSFLLRRLHIQNGSQIEVEKDFKWLGTKIFNKLKIQEIHEPTEIQQYTWAYAKEERDMIAISRTGSGKTLGFLGGVKDKQALVLAPTRELVEQISREYQKYFNGKVATVYGGASRQVQIRDLKRKPSLIVATPGRLIDLMNEHHVPLNMDSMVLDEADRMLDMGFEPQLREIMKNIARKQTLMFSATWPRQIQALANEFLNNHVHISVGSTKLTLNKDVTHEFVHCKPIEKLGHLMDKVTSEKTIIFCSTKSMVDRLHDQLVDNRHRSSFMHGDCSQAAREWALQKFKDGKSNILVATDVCGRGIDVSDVKFVINYDMPNDGQDFIHRIGRTGRAGKSGKAISYVTEKDAGVCKELVDIFQESEIPAPEHLLVVAAMRAMSKGQRGGQRGSQRGGYRQSPSRGPSSFSSRGPSSFGGKPRFDDNKPRFGDSKPRFGSDSRDSRPKFNSDNKTARFGDSKPRFGDSKPKFGNGSPRKFNNDRNGPKKFEKRY